MVTVSTVDRYQGDENDIVILSLVRAQPGNRFVALLNRFIVAVSRARMGMYVVGCVDAVTKSSAGVENTRSTGPKHWVRFVNDLRVGNGSNKQDKVAQTALVDNRAQSNSSIFTGMLSGIFGVLKPAIREVIDHAAGEIEEDVTGSERLLHLYITILDITILFITILYITILHITILYITIFYTHSFTVIINIY